MTDDSIPANRLLNDLAECPVCQETYTDPRVLPCFHTYCLDCITKWSKEKLPGTEINCPLCRQAFVIPANGIEDLPKNIFIDNLLTLKKISEVKSCDWCSTDEDVAEGQTNAASVFCMDCRESLCNSCNRYHSKMKVFPSHGVIKIEENAVDKLSARHLLLRCEKHPSDVLRGYCVECEESICFTCSFTQHSGHQSADIKVVAGQLRLQVTDNISLMGKIINLYSQSFPVLGSLKVRVTDRATLAGSEICKKAEEMTMKIESDKRRLLSDLDKAKSSLLQELDIMFAIAQQNKTTAESLRKYSEELLRQGSDNDIVHEANKLHARTVDLAKCCQKDRTNHDQFDPCIIFRPTYSALLGETNSIGTITRGQSKQLSTALHGYSFKI